MKKEPNFNKINRQDDSKDYKKSSQNQTKCNKNTKKELKYISRCCKNIEN